MKLVHAFDQIGVLSTLVSSEQVSDLLSRFVEITKLGGEFPVSRELREDLQRAIGQPNFRVERLPQELCHDLFIPIRLLALANTAMYSRGTDIEDLQTVGSLFGVTSIAERFGEIGSVGSVSDFFRGRSLALAAYQNALLRGHIAQNIYTSLIHEQFPSYLPFLISVMTELPVVLLAYSKPNIFAACWLDMLANENLSIERPFKRVLEDSPAGYFFRMAEVLGLPRIFSEYVLMAEVAPWNKRSWSIPKTERNRMIMSAVYVSGKILPRLTSFTERQSYLSSLGSVEGKGDITKKLLEESMTNTLSQFIDSTKRITVPALRLPQFLEMYEDRIVDSDGTVGEAIVAWPSLGDRLDPFITELKACLSSHASLTEFMRFPQALLCTVLALLRGMNFERCFLYTVEEEEGEQIFIPKVVLGDSTVNPQVQPRRTGNLGPYDPDYTAFREGQAVFRGDPIFADHWPFVAFPIVCEGEIVAVVYADKRESKDAQPLSTEEQVACITLAESWIGVSNSFY